MGRGCFPAHLTASCLVVDAARDHVLLTLHGKAQQWFQFGGHCEDEDATLAGAALREATEESGVTGLVLLGDDHAVPAQLDAHDVGFCHPEGTVAHLDVRYVAVAPEGAAHATSEESLDVRWWPVEALPTPEPSLVELVARVCGRAGQASSTSATASTPARESSGSTSSPAGASGSSSAPMPSPAAAETPSR